MYSNWDCKINHIVFCFNYGNLPATIILCFLDSHCLMAPSTIIETDFFCISYYLLKYLMKCYLVCTCTIPEMTTYIPDTYYNVCY